MNKLERIVNRKPSNDPEINICITSKQIYIERFNAALIKKSGIEDKDYYCAVFHDKPARILHFQFTEDNDDLNYKLTKFSTSSGRHMSVSLKTINIKPGKYKAHQSEKDLYAWFIKYW